MASYREIIMKPIVDKASLGFSSHIEAMLEKPGDKGPTY